MAKFCSKCGTQMEDNMMFCANCGNRVDGGVPVGAPAQASMMGGSKPDIVAILKGKADQKTNWLVALVAQVLPILLFLLPILSFSIPASLRAFASDEMPGPMNFFAMSSYMTNEMDINATVVFPIIGLILAIGAGVYMALPFIQKTEFNPMGAFVMLCGQAIFFIGNVITVMVYSGKVSDLSMGMVKTVFNFGGWMYILFSLVALYFVGMIVFYNKDKLLKKNTAATFTDNYYQ